MTEKALVATQLTILIYPVSKNFRVRVISRTLPFDFDLNFSEELQLFDLEVIP